MLNVYSIFTESVIIELPYMGIIYFCVNTSSDDIQPSILISYQSPSGLLLVTGYDLVLTPFRLWYSEFRGLLNHLVTCMFT